MSSVALPTVFLTNAADLTTSLQLDVQNIEDTIANQGDVRVYAAGNSRSISQVGRRREIPLKFEMLTPAQVATLTAWATQLLLFRDPRGRKVWGVYYALKVSEYLVVSFADVEVTFIEVTYDESV